MQKEKLLEFLAELPKERLLAFLTELTNGLEEIIGQEKEPDEREPSEKCEKCAFKAKCKSKSTPTFDKIKEIIEEDESIQVKDIVLAFTVGKSGKQPIISYKLRPKDLIAGLPEHLEELTPDQWTDLAIIAEDIISFAKSLFRSETQKKESE